MQMKRSKKRTSFILCMVLIVAMALGTTGCNGSAGRDTASNEGTEVSNPETDSTGKDTDSDEGTDSAGKGADSGEGADSPGKDTDSDAETVVSLGTGSTVFSLIVADQEGEETPFEIHTDKKTVGEALQEVELIEGEEGEYGLYIKTVNGITVDYDKDGAYWAFYVNGEYASSGVDTTKITEGESYALKVDKGK